MNSTPSTLTDDLGRSLREALVKRLRGDDPDYPDDGLEAANWLESLEAANAALTVRIADLTRALEDEVQFGNWSEDGDLGFAAGAYNRLLTALQATALPNTVAPTGHSIDDGIQMLKDFAEDIKDLPSATAQASLASFDWCEHGQAASGCREEQERRAADVIAAARSLRTFTMYRRNVPEATHNANQKNAPNEPQFEGAVFSDGRVAIRWLTAKRSVSVWDSIEDMLAIHGHPEYGSEMVWHDRRAVAALGEDK